MTTRTIFVSFTARNLDGERVFGNAEVGFSGAIKGGREISEIEAYLHRDSPNIMPQTIIVTNWRAFE